MVSSWDFNGIYKQDRKQEVVSGVIKSEADAGNVELRLRVTRRLGHGLAQIAWWWGVGESLRVEVTRITIR